MPDFFLNGHLRNVLYMNTVSKTRYKSLLHYQQRHNCVPWLNLRLSSISNYFTLIWFHLISYLRPSKNRWKHLIESINNDVWNNLQVCIRISILSLNRSTYPFTHNQNQQYTDTLIFTQSHWLTRTHISQTNVSIHTHIGLYRQ